MWSSAVSRQPSSLAVASWQVIEADANTLRLLRGERETVAVALRGNFFVVFSADWFCGFLHL